MKKLLSSIAVAGSIVLASTSSASAFELLDQLLGGSSWGHDAAVQKDGCCKTPPKGAPKAGHGPSQKCGHVHGAPDACQKRPHGAHQKGHPAHQKVHAAHQKGHPAHQKGHAHHQRSRQPGPLFHLFGGHAHHRSKDCGKGAGKPGKAGGRLDGTTVPAPTTDEAAPEDEDEGDVPAPPRPISSSSA